MDSYFRPHVAEPFVFPPTAGGFVPIINPYLSTFPHSQKPLLSLY